MAVVYARRRRRVGLGDLSTDMHNAAMAAQVVSDLPHQNVPYLQAYQYNGQVYINMDDTGDTPNWVGYTDAFYGKSDAEKTLFWGGKGAEVALPGWTPQRALDDPAGYQQALADFRATNAAAIARVTASVEQIQTAERAGTQATVATVNRAQIEQDARAALAYRIAAGAVFADTLRPGGYTRAYLTGLLTTVEWVQDEISAEMGGTRANEIRMRGRIPSPLPAGVYISDDPARQTVTGGGPVVSTPIPPLPTYVPSYVPVPVLPAPGAYIPYTTYGGGAGGTFAEANGGSSANPVFPSGGGGGGAGGGGFGPDGGGAPVAAGLSLSSPLVLGAVAVAAVLWLRRR